MLIHAVTRGTRLRLLALAGACLLTLGACGGTDDEAGSSSAAKATPAETAAKTASDGDQFCEQAKANKATGASFGEVQAFLPKEGLAKEVDGALAVMRGVTPAEDIGDAWRTRKAYLTKLKAAVAKVPAGGKLADPGLVSDPAASKASKTITDYWFDTCQ